MPPVVDLFDYDCFDFGFPVGFATLQHYGKTVRALPAYKSTYSVTYRLWSFHRDLRVRKRVTAQHVLRVSVSINHFQVTAALE